MRTEKTVPPSFPQVETDTLLSLAKNERWQVMCGDDNHWRVGMYSPQESSRQDIQELEWHDCPELFMLVSGRLNLLIRKGTNLIEVPLEPLKPILVTSPHNGFCPDGPGTGIAIVVERDRFVTHYRNVDEIW